MFQKYQLAKRGPIYICHLLKGNLNNQKCFDVQTGFYSLVPVCIATKIVSEYDQEIPQSQTADNPMAPRGRAAQPLRDARNQIKHGNQLSLPHQEVSTLSSIF